MATAKAGETLTIVGGAEIVVRTPAAETGGQRVELEFTLPPGSSGPPAHVHPEQEEEWHVLAGTFSVYLDGEWRDVEAGQSVSIPRGRAHTFRNSSGGSVRVRDVHVPALDFQDYMESLDRLTRSGKVKSLRSPSSLVYLSMVLRDQRPDQISASPVQRAAESALAFVGRLLRFRTP